MQKIALILVIGYFSLISCSVFKHTAKTEIEKSDKLFTVNDLEKVEDRNITNQNFFITKADIEIYGSEGTEKAILSIKYLFPGEYLLSIRNRTGIEAARIFISKDSVLVNDRINRKLYYGSRADLVEKYGVDQSIIPILLGDFVTGDYVNEKSGICMNGSLERICNVGGITINYILDCKRLKVISAVAKSGKTGEPIKLNFSGFKKGDKFVIPGEIEIKNIRKIEKIILKIRKLEYPWEGSIDFIPGSRYEALPLR